MEPIDLDRLSTDWFENQDPHRAVYDAKAELKRLQVIGEEPSRALESLERVIEPACDGPGGDSRLAFDVANASEGAFRDAEGETGLRTPEQLELRSRSQLVIARAAYRAGYERQAFVRSLALLTWIAHFVEGRQALLVALRSSLPNGAAAAAVRALGLYPAALRRSTYGVSKQAHFLGLARPFVEAYLDSRGPGGIPVIYDRTHALASQWLYALLDAVPDDPLIARLIELEHISRPDNARGHATEPLRDFELASRAGDDRERERQRAEAKIRLEAFPLERHLRTVERRRYLAA